MIMTRARIVSLIACGVMASLGIGVTALAQGSREPIKIGVLNSITGPLAVNGTEINEGIKLYWEDEMSLQVAGRQVRLIVDDDEAKPDVGLTKTKKMVESDKVQVILGPVSSAIAVDMREYVHARKIPLIDKQSTATTHTIERTCSAVVLRAHWR